MSHSLSSHPFAGPPSQMACPQTMMRWFGGDGILTGDGDDDGECECECEIVESTDLLLATLTAFF